LIGNDGSLNFTQEIAELANKTYRSKTTPTAVNPRSSLEPWELAYVRQVRWILIFWQRDLRLQLTQKLNSFDQNQSSSQQKL